VPHPPTRKIGHTDRKTIVHRGAQARLIAAGLQRVLTRA
jgi:hypothetical protein